MPIWIEGSLDGLSPERDSIKLHLNVNSNHDCLHTSITGIKSILIMNMLSITKSCVTLCDPMDWSMPGFLVLHYLPEFPQTHVLWVSGAIQPFHPLLPPSPSALNLSQHGVFSNEPTFQMPGMLQSMGVTKSSIKNTIKNLKKNTIKNLNSNTLDTTSAQISKLIWRLSQGVPPENNAKDQRNELLWMKKS